MGLSVTTRAFVLSLVLCAVLAAPSVPHAPDAHPPSTPSVPHVPAAPSSSPSVPHTTGPITAPSVPHATTPAAHVESEHGESEDGADNHVIHDEKFYTPKAALTTAASMGIIAGIIGFLFLLFIIMIFLCNKAASKHHAAPAHHVAGQLATPNSAVPLGPTFDSPKLVSPIVAQPQTTPSFQALTGPVFLSPSQTPFHSRAPSDAADELSQQAQLQAIAHAQATYGVGSSMGSFYGQPPVPPAFPNAG